MNEFQQVLYNQIEKIQASNLPSHVKKVVSAVSLCRTNAMKGRVYSCPTGHFSVFMRESCNNRSCPTCQSENKRIWNINTKQKVTNSTHYHLVFKLPSFLYPYILTHYKDFIEILFEASSKTIHTLIKYSFDLTPTPAFISVLHTHGDQYQLHPHIHVILNSITLSKKQDKLLFLDEALFKLDNFNSVYNHILKKELINLYKKNPELGIQFKENINNFHNENIFISNKYDSPFPIIDYLSKTIKGNALDLNQVEFLINGSTQIHKKDKTFSFSNDEFVNRYIKHIIPQNIKSIRYSGFYSSASKEKYLIVNSLYNLNLQLEAINNNPDLQFDDVSHKIHKSCPICNQTMILREEVDEFKVPDIVYIKFGKDPPTEDLFTKLVA
ncbi:IS91 family transposase [Leptospira bandrabouensis]|uniref:Transposase n=1 Tax=Leptospira bandrabouensis TaxID=2484903 RepID=A0A6H3NT03_9LEPT|nr:transposase zinc-binding domain-containing protein [Leptospira bandrabouensis]MCG6154074.1 transposase zinc-binding domain-containing protein [Leptospira bandrabouensis]TGN09100.1 transposase [Leptospira bandrabouensis]TGN14022.1 transposase [Leptospira bandrabouensis]